MDEEIHKSRVGMIIGGLALGVLLIVGTIVFAATYGKHNEQRTTSSTVTATTSSSAAATTSGSGTGGGSGQGKTSGTTVVWQAMADGWQPTSTPPACPNPLNLPTPVNLANVTAILYPGQTRGGNYKPHGGFRFDGAKDNNVTVTAPMDAQVVRGARYLVDGETQYTFDFINSCGLMYRLGHLLTLSTKYQALADKFPAAVEGDSRTSYIDPTVSVTAGETIATAIGVTKGTNVFVDFGVYDLNKKNEAAQDATWAADPMHDSELAQHAVCWLTKLSAADTAQVENLPAGDPTSGKTSDFCK